MTVLFSRECVGPVAVGQLPKLLGIPVQPNVHGFFRDLWSVLNRLDKVNVATMILGTATVALLLISRKWLPGVPMPLIAVVVTLILVPVLGLTSHGVRLIAPVPRGLPVPHLPPLEHVGAMLPGASAIALMVLLETVAVARGVRLDGEQPPDPDHELIAIGIASATGSIFGSMPPAGGFSQSTVNKRAGARTQVAGLVLAGLAVLVALLLAPELSNLPEATLGAMVLVAVTGLIRPAELARFWRISRREFGLAAVTIAAGLTLGLLGAVGVGVIGTLLLVLHELNRLSVTELRPLNGILHPVYAGGDAQPGLLVLRLDGPLYAANIRPARRAILAAMDATQPAPHVVVVDGTALVEISVTVLDGLRELTDDISARGATTWLTSIPPASLAIAQRTTWLPSWRTTAARSRRMKTRSTASAL